MEGIEASKARLNNFGSYCVSDWPNLTNTTEGGGVGMGINLGLFSSKTDMWSTPQDFFEKLNKEFRFDIDLCATLENAKCPVFITPEDDFLRSTPWIGPKQKPIKTAWMNPPYGRKIGDFMRKAYECSFVGGWTVVCLVPARTDTRWWHDWAVKGEIRFIKGRLKFGDQKTNAPFPSAVVIFRGKV